MRRLLFVVALIGSGFGLGRAAGTLADSAATDEEWPARGQGPTLTEYFDPQCGQSRHFHLELVELLAKSPRVRHVLVPIALDRDDGHPPADLLCATPPERTWELAMAWSRHSPSSEDQVQVDPARLETCTRRVIEATQETARLHAAGVPVSPLVELNGRVYVGRPSLEDLERALREL
jgi:hypothetical protein